jgi:uridylate kinase
MYTEVNYEQVLRDKLRVMDLTAITLLMERQLPLVVFNLKKQGNIMRVVMGEKVGTHIIPK